jgi:type IV secretion system protein VirB5
MKRRVNVASEAIPRLAVDETATLEPVAVGAANAPGLSTNESPYLAARREWDERYGDLITRARNWRFAAFLALVIAVIETGGLIALSMKAKVVPFVVAVDNLSRVVGSGTADQVSPADDRLKRATLVQWVSDLRMITSDGVAQRKAIDRVYSMIGRGTPAQVQVGEFYRSDPPHNRARTQMVSVDVKAVYASSEKTYEVEWVEVARGITGDVQSEQRWKGSFTIALNPPTDERLARVNPLGLYITNLSWSKVL